VASRVARWKLEHRARAPARERTPRPHVLGDPDHAAITVEEDDIDSKAHEVRVHRPGTGEDHRLAGTKLLVSEQAARARQRGAGDAALPRNGLPVIPC
jgi:hypothetical protein